MIPPGGVLKSFSRCYGLPIKDWPSRDGRCLSCWPVWSGFSLWKTWLRCASHATTRWKDLGGGRLWDFKKSKLKPAVRPFGGDGMGAFSWMGGVLFDPQESMLQAFQCRLKDGKTLLLGYKWLDFGLHDPFEMSWVAFVGYIQNQVATKHIQTLCSTPVRRKPDVCPNQRNLYQPAVSK